MAEAVKAFLKEYNVSVTLVGTAVVLSTAFGTCSYDATTGEVEVNPSDAEDAAPAEEAVEPVAAAPAEEVPEPAEGDPEPEVE